MIAPVGKDKRGLLGYHLKQEICQMVVNFGWADLSKETRGIDNPFTNYFVARIKLVYQINIYVGTVHHQCT